MNLIIQQGWQCPCCSRIYSPTTSICFYCPPIVETAQNTSPPQRQPLTDKQMDELVFGCGLSATARDIARAIEAAHGIGENK